MRHPHKWCSALQLRAVSPSLVALRGQLLCGAEQRRKKRAKTVEWVDCAALSRPSEERKRGWEDDARKEGEKHDDKKTIE